MNTNDYLKTLVIDQRKRLIMERDSLDQRSTEGCRRYIEIQSELALTRELCVQLDTRTYGSLH